MRDNGPNYIAAGCGALHAVLFLLLPFYTVMSTVPVTGLQMLRYAPAATLILGCSALMILGALLLKPKISMAIAGVSLLVTIIFMFLGATLVQQNALIATGSTLLESVIGVNVSSLAGLARVDAGFGAYLCAICCIAVIVVEVTLGSTSMSGTHVSTDVDSPEDPLF